MVSRKLPSELEEEILIHLPPLTLARFRAVCKRWNALFNEKSFVNNHLAYAPSRSSEFMLQTDSKIYSISINLIDDDPIIKVRELTFDVPWLASVNYEVATNTWKSMALAHHIDKSITGQSLRYNTVRLNGNLYWTAQNSETGQYFIRILDCSKAILKPFCILPCETKDLFHTRKLAVFKGDRFSLLEQCRKTRKIEIWVTKKKIPNGNDGDAVVWIRLMSVSIPKFPRLYQTYDYESSSYMVYNNIYGKCFAMCCDDETGQACVYLQMGDICKKMQIDEVAGELRRCSVYVPSLISIP